jgi:hypothetical protein
MAVNLETNFPISLNQQWKINLSNLLNKPRRRRSPDGSEFRNKFPYFSESTMENKSFQLLKVCGE